jgi:hypothetical protein
MADIRLPQGRAIRTNTLLLTSHIKKYYSNFFTTEHTEGTEDFVLISL